MTHKVLKIEMDEKESPRGRGKDEKGSAKGSYDDEGKSSDESPLHAAEAKPLLVSRGSHGDISRSGDSKSGDLAKEMGSMGLGGDVSPDSKACRVAEGLQITYMDMRDGNTNRLLWESDAFRNNPRVYEEEMSVDIPKEILSCRIVSRELKFSSHDEIENFKLEQRVLFHGQMIETWRFEFGFVIPNSYNSWQQIIEAAPPDKMLPPEMLSGNVVFETNFYDGDIFLASSRVRINYV